MGTLLKMISTVRQLYRWRGSLVLFCTTVRLTICHDTEAFPGNLGRRGDQPHTSITWPRASRSFIYSLKWTPPSKKISGPRKYVTKNVASELNSEFLLTPPMTALDAFLFQDYTPESPNFILDLDVLRKLNVQDVKDTMKVLKKQTRLLHNRFPSAKLSFGCLSENGIVDRAPFEINHVTPPPHLRYRGINKSQ